MPPVSHPLGAPRLRSPRPHIYVGGPVRSLTFRLRAVARAWAPLQRLRHTARILQLSRTGRAAFGALSRTTSALLLPLHRALGVLRLPLSPAPPARRIPSHWAPGAVRLPLNRAARAQRSQHGQATTEYALVLLGAAAVALLLVAWATRTGAISSLLDAVVASIRRKV